jgi:hypothetical protein
MESFARHFSGAEERGHRRRRGLAAVAIAVAAGVLASQGAASVARGYRFEPSSSILAEHVVSGYPIGSGHPTGVCRIASPQDSPCDSFLIMLVLKRSATSVVVSFDGLSGKLRRPKVSHGTTSPSGFPLSTGTFFTGQIPTVSLLTSTNTNRGSGAFPTVGSSGYGTFDALITLSDGSRITTDFRAYLSRGWQ